MSDSQRQGANEWFDHTLYSRLNDKQQGAIVLIMHRLHEDDLVGHVLGQEDWDIVRLPAIAEDDVKIVVGTLLGRRRFDRRRGEALHQEREPLQMLEQIRRTIGEYNFAGQYQQMPAPLGGWARQGGLVQALHAGGAAGLRPHRAELGYRQQGDRAQRFQRLHQLGDQARTSICSMCCAGAWNTLS